MAMERFGNKIPDAHLLHSCAGAGSLDQTSWAPGYDLGSHERIPNAAQPACHGG